MKKTTKWAKVFSIFLLLSLVILNTSSVQGERGGRGTKTPMHAIARENALGEDCPIYYGENSPLFSGDTTETEICPHAGAIIPSNNRNFWTNMGGCIEDLTLSGYIGDIDIDVIGFMTYRNKKTGEVEAIKIDLIGLPGEGGFQTDKIEASGAPDPLGFRITVCQDYIEVKRRQKGRPIVVGLISVGVIDYEPK